MQTMSEMKWIASKDKKHPDKPGLESYEHVPCLVIHRGMLLFRLWNCEHLCWDDEDGDDYYCDAGAVSYWAEIGKLPTEREGGE
jgi:hypothetical protein